MIDLALVYPADRPEDSLGMRAFSPLSLAYLARHTPAGFHIRLFDEHQGQRFDAATERADLVAVSAITPGIPRSYAIADALAQRGIPSVLGGAHASALPDEALEHFHTVVLGEGEEPWRRIIADFETDSLQRRYEAPANPSLHDLGVPDRRFVHPSYFTKSLMTSRGCPHRCSFCYQNVYKGRHYRPIPHDFVLEDIASLQEEKVVSITDANFIGYSERDRDDRKVLLERMIRQDAGLFYGCQATVGLAQDPELMALMRRAGFFAVYLGFESLNPQDLEDTRKRQNLDVDYAEVVARLHEHDMAVIASCIVGMDSHRPGYGERLAAELYRAKVDFVEIKYLTAFPGTPLYDELEASGRVSKDWLSVDPVKPSLQFKHFSHQQLIDSRDRVYDQFFRWSNIGRLAARWTLASSPMPVGYFLKMAAHRKLQPR